MDEGRRGGAEAAVQSKAASPLLLIEVHVVLSHAMKSLPISWKPSVALPSPQANPDPATDRCQY